MEEITLKLTIIEINTMLGALGNLPYVQVMELIAKIQEQAKEQLAATGSNATD
ncbi:hypothetical protein [Pedobacter psychroterrae]|uniref:hypothetical protein n=1 Tax=Pedobacter psychroterrae TaxID=2530453 RepID=UPI0013F15654|nr:hypothetical protein [Pedobacter psychroterrae]